jgi:ATP-dependent Lon protease
MNPQAPDFGIQRNSLDYFGIALECFQSNYWFKNAQKVWSRDARIRGVERRTFGSLKLRNDMKSPIICLTSSQELEKLLLENQ